MNVFSSTKLIIHPIQHNDPWVTSLVVYVDAILLDNDTQAIIKI